MARAPGSGPMRKAVECRYRHQCRTLRNDSSLCTCSQAVSRYLGQDGQQNVDQAGKQARREAETMKKRIPLRASFWEAGDASRLKLAGEESFRLDCGGLGDTSVVVGSEKTSEGVSISGVN